MPSCVDVEKKSEWSVESSRCCRQADQKFALRLTSQTDSRERVQDGTGLERGGCSTLLLSTPRSRRIDEQRWALCAAENCAAKTDGKLVVVVMDLAAHARPCLDIVVACPPPCTTIDGEHGREWTGSSEVGLHSRVQLSSRLAERASLLALRRVHLTLDQSDSMGPTLSNSSSDGLTD